MKKWTRPIFEAFDVNGEVTAYAGATPGDPLPPKVGVGDDRIVRPGPSGGAERTGSPAPGAA